jgi:hypothetical protein
LARSRRHALAAIRSDLQADADLAAAFSAFTSVTLGAAMPEAERLPAWSMLAGWRRCCRAFRNWRIMLAVTMMAAVAAVLALGLALAPTASSPGGQTRCDPAYAFAVACPAPPSAPGSVGGPPHASAPSAYGRP